MNLRSRFIIPLLRFFFFQLYHKFAWSYNLVAQLVSLGLWNDWVCSCLPFIHGPRVLELGHGPGYLQTELHKLGLNPIGLDESKQMGRQAYQRILRSQNTSYRSGYAHFPALIRGLAQTLPFPSNSFQSIVATFPTDYIFETQTLAEVQRVLAPGGQLIIVFAARITGEKIPERLASWLFQVTGQAPDWQSKHDKFFQHTNLTVSTHWIERNSSRVFLIIAKKTLALQTILM